MKKKFKLGDKVKVIDYKTDLGHKSGTEGVITGINRDDYSVTANGKEWYQSEENLELISDKEQS